MNAPPTPTWTCATCPGVYGEADTAMADAQQHLDQQHPDAPARGVITVKTVVAGTRTTCWWFIASPDRAATLAKMRPPGGTLICISPALIAEADMDFDDLIQYFRARETTRGGTPRPRVRPPSRPAMPISPATGS